MGCYSCVACAGLCAGVKTGPETLQMQMNFLNMAMLYIPTQHDAERPKQYFPRNPYPVNRYDAPE